MAVDIPIGTPGMVRHDVLGALSVDLKRARRRYEKDGPELDVLDGEIGGKIQADGAAVSVALCPHLITDLPDWVDRCAARIMQTVAGLPALKAHVAEDHLPLKNERWLERGEPPVSRPEFIERLRLSSVSVHDDDAVEVFFSDGGLFGGHFLIVTIEDGKPGEVSLAG
jgi:Uncharacterized protein conserved in bacteria (DUF2262)